MRRLYGWPEHGSNETGGRISLPARQKNLSPPPRGEFRIAPR